MKVVLKIKKTSNVMSVVGCPKLTEISCGIMYRGF